jgi:hypothetical protein
MSVFMRSPKQHRRDTGSECIPSQTGSCSDQVTQTT